METAIDTMGITPQQAYDALAAVVEELGPDYVYKKVGLDARCLYAFDGGPSCIVGRALVRLGLPLDVLSELDDDEYPSIQAQGAVLLTEAVRGVFGAAQRSQDLGDTYAQALAQAHKAL